MTAALRMCDWIFLAADTHAARHSGIGIRNAESPPNLGQRAYLLLVDTTITPYDTGDDWLELTLDIAWLAPPKLTVNAAVEANSS